jgi:hypothetical protein
VIGMRRKPNICRAMVQGKVMDFYTKYNSKLLEGLGHNLLDFFFKDLIYCGINGL